jgi:hypothetical protein
MILLDTNVISALMTADADPAVVTWLNTQPRESIWTTSITVLEIRFGLELLALGRRRTLLEEAFTKMLNEALEGRVLAFDELAAEAAGRVAAEGRKRGRSVESHDVQIAGIAIVRRAIIATRNIRHFEGLGPVLVNPWSARTN